MLAKLKGWCKNSVTILGARIYTIAGGALAVGTNVLQDPSISSAVQQLFNPKWLPFWIIGTGILFELLRRRTVDKPTDANNQIVTGNS